MEREIPSPVRIRRIFISQDHNYFGHHGQSAGTHQVVELDRVECVAGKGLLGDRFFDHKPNYAGQVTLFAWEVFLQFQRERGLSGLNPGVFRRNLLVEGLSLEGLVGVQFPLQGVVLEGAELCQPCYWMDEAAGPGSESWLRNRGGLRCRIVVGGVLTRD